MRAFDLILAQSWAMTEHSLRQLLEIAGREHGYPEAVAAQMGEKLSYTRTVMIRDGVAVIPVEGPIFRRANLFTEISGATSIQVLATDFHTALMNPAVRAILFEIDSPGGEAAGVHEFSNMIYAARGIKPITAYVGDIGASAAYWIASAADEIVLDETAFVGSVGVVAAVPDPSKQKAREIEIVSSRAPNKRVDPSTEGGRAKIQRIVDALEDVFITNVARNRNTTVDAIVEQYGQGDIVIGAQAVARGMADRIGSFESTLAALAAKGKQPAVVARAQAKERLMPGFKEMWRDMFKAMEEHDTEIPQAERVTEPVEEEVDVVEPTGTAASARQSLVNDEAASLRAQLQAERSQRFKAQAEAFADRQLVAGRIMPAARDALIVAYVQAATDDTQFGGTARVGNLAALVDAHPAHALTQELVPAASDMSVLANQTGEQRDTLSEERKKKLLNMTPLGQSAVNGKHGG